MVRVMVIAPSPTTRKILEVALQRERYQVNSFASASVALQDLSNTLPSLPDVFVIDFSTPETGKLIKDLRAELLIRQIPIIAITDPGFFERMKARQAGVAGYLEKPLKEKEIVAFVQKVLLRWG
ncbi:hypothetical protein KSF_107430 [Reticulibacter mediterranei]|uniref:Response regulatory domain-containing protein n=1 Tax=Reticulibacter mediterranei TaxID=2778369 RepID=A0A8J3J1Q0_9CHLR|nr:response regulator [Reticulibacter mediterranei]GHP00696.1 hypothetical protein KSF_107430 [Reticulibacter mediterranei]